MPKLPTCFVVMAYGRRPVDGDVVDFDAIFDGLIAPAVRAAGLDVERGDRQAVSGVIMPQLLSSIYSADLVLADLTYQNPNVYYELGVRHALRDQGTLLIRRAGGDFAVTPSAAAAPGPKAETAFDIKDIRIWAYDVSTATLATAVAELRDRLVRALNAVEADSPVFVTLPALKVAIGAPQVHANDDATYELVDRGRPIGRFVGYRSGDLKDVKGARAVDYWVNSENVLMKMARVDERSVSSTIRLYGARQPDPSRPGFDDTIAVALTEQLGPRQCANQGEVLVTTAGRLADTHGVKAILHAAVVTGAPGRGFEPIPEDRLVEATCLAIDEARGLARGDDPARVGRSVIMPLFGTGQGRLNPFRTAARQVDEAIRNLAYHAANPMAGCPDVEAVFFSAFTRERTRLLRRLFEGLVANGDLRPLASPHEWKTPRDPERTHDAAAR